MEGEYFLSNSSWLMSYIRAQLCSVFMLVLFLLMVLLLFFFSHNPGLAKVYFKTSPTWGVTSIYSLRGLRMCINAYTETTSRPWLSSPALLLGDLTEGVLLAYMPQCGAFWVFVTTFIWPLKVQCFICTKSCCHLCRVAFLSFHCFLRLNGFTSEIFLS